VRLKNEKKRKKRKKADVIGQKWFDKNQILIFPSVSSGVEKLQFQKPINRGALE